MSHISIIVEFQLHPGCQAEFEEVICLHAKRSLAEEPGCLRFDVMRQQSQPGRQVDDVIWLYETYADEKAVKAHENSQHMPILSERVKNLVAKRRLVYAGVIQN